MSRSTKCGFCGIYPKWLQNWATSRIFIAVYILLGAVPSMAFIYMTVSLTTLEKRFKIPSQTTGIILSGSEYSQILSIFLIYYGGSGHRPRWMALGVAISAASCLIMTLPHFIYGPGQDALALTEEHLNLSIVSKEQNNTQNDFPICTKDARSENCDKVNFTDTSVIPKLIIFFSQFILGIGTTLYYSLGQTYMDDNTKKKNTPMLFGITSSLQSIGPVLTYLFGYFCLNIYVAPTLHPIIEPKDPRWIGAWWLGWVILGIIMLLFALLLSMFPHELKKPSESDQKKTISECEVPLNYDSRILQEKPQTSVRSDAKNPSIKEFLKSVQRILKNKIFLLNLFSGIFYILSASYRINFTVKYVEIQFQTSAGNGTIISGPLTFIGMILGYLISGFLIRKWKPSARPLLFWNVIVGLCYLNGQVSFIFLGCNSGSIQGVDFDTMKINLTTACNANCNCDFVKYSPVCHEPTQTTFFSACHAGCKTSMNDTIFGDCNCVPNLSIESNSNGTFFGTSENFMTGFREYSQYKEVKSGPCNQDCGNSFIVFMIVTTIISILKSSSRIGNDLIDFRCVETRDKSLTQGLSIMILSLFAVIPGPIIAGAIMDSTCVIWDISCENKGNCWIYHRDSFRYYVNLSAVCFCLIAVFFDALVCYHSKGIDLYGDEEEKVKISQHGTKSINDE